MEASLQLCLKNPNYRTFSDIHPKLNPTKCLFIEVKMIAVASYPGDINAANDEDPRESENPRKRQVIKHEIALMSYEKSVI